MQLLHVRLNKNCETQTVDRKECYFLLDSQRENCKSDVPIFFKSKGERK